MHILGELDANLCIVSITIWTTLLTHAGTPSPVDKDNSHLTLTIDSVLADKKATLPRIK